MRRFAAVSVAMLAAAGALAPGASASGGPPIFLSATGVRAPSGGFYDTINRSEATYLVRVAHRREQLSASAPLAPGFGIAAVGLADPRPVGLSADGHTLVLERIGRGRSSFAVFEVPGLRLQRRVGLRGLFGLDGVSPDGRSMYLVHYDRRDSTRYAVRRYDLDAGRMAPRPIVDPSDDEQMRGYPVSRAASPDGAWDYTLYSGTAGGEPPFIHALDVAHGKARCIDLPHWVGGVSSDRLRIRQDGRTLTIAKDQRGTFVPVARVDTSSFEVTRPGIGAGADSGGGGDLPWILIALGAGLAIAAVALFGVPRPHRRRLAD